MSAVPVFHAGEPILAAYDFPKAALVLAGKHNPELLAEYVRVEQAIGHRFRKELSLAEVQAAVNAGEATPVADWRM